MPSFLKFPTRISANQAKDTGMAMVLILLIVGAFTQDLTYLRVAIFALVVNMIWPLAFYPLAVVWLGLSHIIGTVVSKILLSAVFFVLVTPVGLLRRMLGKDSLQLRDFKRTGTSAMRLRDHVFVSSDVEKPY